ncbi:MAG TPA: LCP family protein, partial [Actinomycetota bacterium]|nr:LCP family protein [Actinomycetota bacterium]
MTEGRRRRFPRAGRHRRRRARIAWRAGLAVAALILAGGGVGLGLLLGSGGSEVSSPTPTGSGTPSRLVLLDVSTTVGPLTAVVGAGGPGPAAIVVPGDVFVTIPGQGDGTTRDAAGLPGPEGRVAISNLLGVWIDHYAFTDLAHLGAVIDRAGGIALFGTHTDGSKVRQALEEKGAARELTWQETLRGLFAAGPTWTAGDLTSSDDGGAAASVLADAAGARVAVLPTLPVASGLSRPDESGIARIVADLFGVPDRLPTGVIVLNGTGAPGVGESVASRLIPAGFRVVVSQNASSFDHAVTLVVANTANLRPVAERVRRLLGVGSVSVAGVPSGLG